jgi:hypothetical protein
MCSTDIKACIPWVPTPIFHLNKPVPSLLISISQPLVAASVHFGGEAAGFHHLWVSGALDSAERVANEILRWDFPIRFPKFKLEKSKVFRDEESAEKLFVRGLVSKELEEVLSVL